MLTDWMVIAGRDGRMLFGAMEAIQPQANSPIETFTEFAEDPFMARPKFAFEKRVSC
jgi:hypothetical protein